MKERFPAEQVTRVLDQALVYQCACPAQVCRTIFELRELYDYQRACENTSAQDQAVHATIAEAAAQAHALMEACLARVLVLEGWDTDTLTMPDQLRARMLKPV